MLPPILIDTNVLILLIVGSVDPRLIAIHKNCSSFAAEDYGLLVDLLGSSPRSVLLPNVVTKASNLLRQITDPFKTALVDALGRFIEGQEEIFVESRVAVGHRADRRLGVTDCAALMSGRSDVHLLTVDFDLYRGFLEAGRPVTNFRHVIDRAA